MRAFRLAVACVAVLVGTAGQVQAFPVFFNFAGTIEEIDPAFGGSSFTIGDAVNGSYSFDSAATDLFPADPTIGRYPVSNLSGTFGSTYALFAESG